MIRVGAKELPLVYLLLVLTIEWAFCLEPMGIASDGTVILGFKKSQSLIKCRDWKIQRDLHGATMRSAKGWAGGTASE